ncbi:hypothetical protein NDU88_002793 [Pleurodeles waltl]|uniref:Uncharacterized protein n=1 Tax=Pleurodeles waltl TaxID=8319 RepID=A0AAV7QAD5_PLEWA|nr:hypothetical protein NDU88_002793 [Pleurodeles waltl]
MERGDGAMTGFSAHTYTQTSQAAASAASKRVPQTCCPAEHHSPDLALGGRSAYCIVTLEKETSYNPQQGRELDGGDHAITQGLSGAAGESRLPRNPVTQRSGELDLPHIPWRRAATPAGEKWRDSHDRAWWARLDTHRKTRPAGGESLGVPRLHKTPEHSSANPKHKQLHRSGSCGASSNAGTDHDLPRGKEGREELPCLAITDLLRCPPRPFTVRDTGWGGELRRRSPILLRSIEKYHSWFKQSAGAPM